MISVAHAQTHVLLASYEFKMMYFPRAWMSTGSAIRLCQMCVADGKLVSSFGVILTFPGQDRASSP
jgi:hypothetical protein